MVGKSGGIPAYAGMTVGVAGENYAKIKFFEIAPKPLYIPQTLG